MGWDIDNILLHEVRKMLGDRYAGCMYGMMTSNSPVIIRHRGITRAERTEIVGMFPDHIRVEFQPTTLPHNITRIYGLGDRGDERVCVIWPLNLSSEEMEQALIDGGILNHGQTVPMTEDQAQVIGEHIGKNDSPDLRDAPICIDEKE